MSGPESAFTVVDASVWVSRLVAQDTFHGNVKNWMETQREKGMIFLSPALLLAEVAGAISRRTGEAELAKQAINSLANLPGLRLVEMDQSLVKEAAGLAADLGIRGADSFYVAVAARLRIPLATLDQDQGTRSASTVTVQIPTLSAP